MTYYDTCRLSAKAHKTEDLVEMIEKLDKAPLVAENNDMFRALNDEFESRWNTQENYNRLHAEDGGSFNRAIIDAFFKADNNNKPRLVRAFLEIFMPSTEWQEHQKKRALKQAIRATHSGTMGDPMRPTTR
jgi:hypothetical protein